MAIAKVGFINGKIWDGEIHQFGFGNWLRLARQKVTS
jgi:hypothetical protein